MGTSGDDNILLYILFNILEIITTGIVDNYPCKFTELRLFSVEGKFTFTPLLSHITSDFLQ
jgi:hypothetical protein